MKNIEMGRRRGELKEEERKRDEWGRLGLRRLHLDSLIKDRGQGILKTERLLYLLGVLNSYLRNYVWLYLGLLLLYFLCMCDRNRKSESGSKQGVASSLPERPGMDPYKKNLGLGEEREVGMAKSLRERDTTSSSSKKDPATIRSLYKLESRSIVFHRVIL